MASSNRFAAMTFAGMWSVLLAAFITCSLTNCAPDEYRPIPVGVYSHGKDYGEKIFVSQTEITFYIKIDNYIIQRKLNYSVLPDGTINLYTMASSELLTGIGRYEWYWDGKNIIQRDFKTGDLIKKFKKRDGGIKN